MDIKVAYKISERFFCMFWHGEKYNDIKSSCLVDYANFLHEKKKLDQAIGYYEMALRFNSENYYAYSGLAAVFAEKKLFKEALDCWNKATSIKAPDILMNFLLIVIYESLGEKPLAREVLQKTLKFFDNNLADALDRVAYTYFTLGMYHEAETYCLEALHVNPNEAGIHYNLATVLRDQKKFQEAKAELQKVLDLTSDKRYRKFAIKTIRQIDSMSNK
jgi:tetratricopeptide (TPR) repeat protein